MSTEIDVLVVGAGPVGLTLANELARHGVACRIVDKCAAPTDKSKALVVWSRTLELLDRMGVAERFLATGTHTHGVSMYAEGRRVAQLTFDDLDSPYRFALSIPQSETERLLIESLEARGLKVERRTELIGLGQNAEAVDATLRMADGAKQRVRCRYLIGCDGAHSAVRHLLGIDFAGEAHPNDWLLADVALDGPLARDEISVYWHEDGPLLFFPFGKGRIRVVCDAGPAHGERPCEPSLAQMQAAVDRRGPGGLHLSDPAWLAGFRINERKVKQYRHGRVFLAGDAAHIHSPAGGQGMNTGMQDAFNLAWKLALTLRDRAGEVLLDSYSQERSRVGDLVLSRTGAVTRAATLRSPVSQFIRNKLVTFLGSLEIVHDRVRRGLSELDIEYRHSPLSREQRSSVASAWLLGAGIRPGDRAPDADPLISASGASRRLFELLRGTQLHLLLFAGADPEDCALQPLVELARAVQAEHSHLVRSHVLAPSAPGDAPADPCLWHDIEHAAHRKYAAAARSLYLIRPDGYVALRSQSVSADVVSSYLRRILK